MTVALLVALGNVGTGCGPMARWLNEHTYDDAVRTAVGAFPSVPADVVKAIIASESGFNANAIRGEPQRDDASRGLMQLLLSTAQGVGYGGRPEDLFLPAINVYYGTKLLATLYAQLGNWPDAISAYNGGVRPSLGFGRRATAPVRICARWNSRCNEWRDVPVGEYGNQPYVDRVLGNVTYFQGKALAPPGMGPPAPLTLPGLSMGAPAPTIPGLAGGGTVALALLAAVVFLGRREKRRG